MHRENQTDHHIDGHARVRHVPIYVESRGDSVDPSGNLNNQDGETIRQGQNRIYSNLNQRNHRFPESVPMHRNHHHVNSNQHYDQDYNRLNTNLRPEVHPVDVSSIDISYRPSSNLANQQYQQQPREHTNNQHSHEHRQDFKNSEANANKENSEKTANQLGTSKSPDGRRAKQQQQQQEKQLQPEDDKADLGDRPRTPAVIPLPPPPEQEANEGAKIRENNPPPREPVDQLPKQQQQQQYQQQQQQQQQGQGQGQKEQSTEFKKPKKESGPLGVIMATKQEVNKLLHEVVNCNETSLKSKEYLRLDELLTRCILKLDDIECGDSRDLRQQRKAVIELIDKCTDILQRKVQLNHDIQSLALRSASCD